MVTSSRVRSALFDALSKASPPSHDGLRFHAPTAFAVRMVAIPGDLLLRLNETLGRPLAPKAELDKREIARARLTDLRTCAPIPTAAKQEQAPVAVYFEGDRNIRERARIEELLQSKGIAYAMVDVTGDDAALAFARSKAKCEQDELPIVFVADHAIGTYSALVASDVAGTFQALLFPPLISA